MLRADNVSFAYGASPVLRGVSVTVPRGGSLGILGPNGAGKTTLLRLLAGMLQPATGRVTLDDTEVGKLGPSHLARRMAIVPQETHMAFDYTVLELALMGRYPHLRRFELEGPDDLAIAYEALAATGTAALARRAFMTLSGGEKQRVIIASALAQFWRLGPEARSREENQPSVALLLDEPTASLDLGYQIEIATILKTLNRQREIAMVISTHDLNFAATAVPGTDPAAGWPRRSGWSNRRRSDVGVRAAVVRRRRGSAAPQSRGSSHGGAASATRDQGLT